MKMRTVWIIVPAVVLFGNLAAAAKPFSCDQGCKGNEDCPKQSYCVAISPNSDCGLCLCQAGYRTEGKDCVPNKPQEKSQKSPGNGAKGSPEKPKSTSGNGAKGSPEKPKSTSGPAPTSTSSTYAPPRGTAAASASGNPTPTTAAPGTGAPSTGAHSTGGPSTGAPSTGAHSSGAHSSGAPSTGVGGGSTAATTKKVGESQAPSSAGGSLNCEDYDCQDVPDDDSDSIDNPFTVRARRVTESPSSKCKNKLFVPARPCKMEGGGTCYGEDCLQGEGGSAFCVCPPNRVDRQCAVTKPGKCASGTGQVPPNAYQAQNKRFVHKTNPQNGAIYGRHYASNFNECVKLCQWASGSCRSVSYGTLGGKTVCELLSVVVNKGNPLEGWLVDSPGWQYAVCSTQ